MPLISIITAAYNSEKYIRTTIESVICQSFSDWEYIIVDDGSTDGTLEIIREYAERDGRIRFKSISNSGSARRPFGIGISMAGGEWILPLGHDDYLEGKDLEKLYQRTIETGADIVLQRMVAFEEKGKAKYTIPASGFDMNKVITGREACALTIGKWDIGVNGCLCRKHVWADVHLGYPDTRNLMNLDEVDTRRLLLSVEKVAFCDADYYYWVRPDSITRKPSVKRFDILITNQMLRDLIEKNYDAGDPVVKRMYIQELYGVVSCRMFYLQYRHIFDPADKRKIRKQMKNSYREANTGDLSDVPFLKKMALFSNYSLFLTATYLYSFFKQ